MGADRPRFSARLLPLAIVVAVAVAVSAGPATSPAVPGGQTDRLAIDGIPPLLSVGTALRPAVYLRDATGARVNVTGSVVWTSSNIAVVTVDKGEVRAIAAGEARIAATWGDATSAVAVRVIAGPVPARVPDPGAEPEYPAPKTDSPARDRPAASGGGATGVGSGGAAAPAPAGIGAAPPTPPSAQNWRGVGTTLVTAVWADFSLSSAPATAKATQLHLGRSTVYATWLVVGLALLVSGLVRGAASHAWVSGALLAAVGAVLGVISPGLARLPGLIFDVVAVVTVFALLVVAQLAFSVGGFRWRDPVARRSLVILIWFALGFAAAFAWAVWSLMRNPLQVT